MNKLDPQYNALIQKILYEGNEKSSRAGDTISLFSGQIIHDMDDGFPLLTGKAVNINNVKNELLWFLSGSTKLRVLLNMGCNIWNGDAYKHYTLENPDTKMTMGEFIDRIKTRNSFNRKWGDLGPIYGKQWINYGKSGKDQILQLKRDLINSPDSRRLLVNVWNVDELDQMTLPPCHYSFQCYVRTVNHIQYLSLMFNMRSSDVGLGLPYNLASYGLLLQMLAHEVNMTPDKLIYSGGDIHIYKNHIEGLKEQISRPIIDLPQVNVHLNDNWSWDISLMNYNPHPAINLPLSN